MFRLPLYLGPRARSSYIYLFDLSYFGNSLQMDKLVSPSMIGSIRHRPRTDLESTERVKAKSPRSGRSS